MNISPRELNASVDSSRNFFKTFCKSSKPFQKPLPKPNIDVGYTKSKNNIFGHYKIDVIEYPIGQIRLLFRFGNNNSCVFAIQKIELHGIQFMLAENAKLNHREIHHSHKNPYMRNKQVWNYWERLRSVAHSTLIVGMTKALLNLLETCIVQIQSVRIYFACTERLCNLSTEKTNNVFNAGPRNKCAIFLLNNKQIRVFGSFVKGYILLKRRKINSRCCWSCVVYNMPKRDVCLPFKQ